MARKLRGALCRSAVGWLPEVLRHGPNAHENRENTTAWSDTRLHVAPFTLLGIDHVVLRIADLDRSLAFYVSVLGCTVDKRQEDIGLIQLRAGHSQIDLVPLDGKRGKAGGAAPGAEGRNESGRFGDDGPRC